MNYGGGLRARGTSTAAFSLTLLDAWRGQGKGTGDVP
jgi:hypothetical protein